VAAPTATLLSRALDPLVEPPDDATSERILDAALALAAASGIRHLTMDDVARRAGVGRMTVYRRFGEREGLVEALSVREVRRCLTDLDAAIGPGAPVADQVADGLVTSVRLAREHPLLNRLARFEPGTVLEAFNDPALLTAARGFVVARLRDAHAAGLLGPIEIDEVAEVMIRLGLSFVLIQDSVLPLDDEARLRAAAKRLIAPILGGG